MVDRALMDYVLLPTHKQLEDCFMRKCGEEKVEECLTISWWKLG